MARDDDGRSPKWNAGPPNWEKVVVPDDARELDADVRALRRERRAKKRNEFFRRFLVALGWRRFGLAGPILVSVLLIAIGFTSLMLLLPNQSQQFAKPAPLAHAVRPVNQEGGLAPDIQLTDSDNHHISLRSVRPAAVFVIPPNCNCDAQMQSVASTAQSNRIHTVFVGKQTPQLPPNTSDAGVIRAQDPNEQLSHAYHLEKGNAPSLLLMRADGVMNRVLTSVPPADQLNGEFAVLTSSPR